MHESRRLSRGHAAESGSRRAGGAAPGRPRLQKLVHQLASVSLGLAYALQSSALRAQPSDAPAERGTAPARQSAGTSPPPDSQLSAYHAALAAKRLDAFGPLSVDKLRSILASAEAELALGRRDEVISVLGGLLASPRFTPLRGLEEGRAAVFLLGHALAQAGAYGAARAHLLRLVQGPPLDSNYRRAASRLVDIGLEGGDPEAVLKELSVLPVGSGQPWAGDVAYLRGILHERAGRLPDAFSAYAEVPPNARFWAQANYRSGLIEVEQGRLPQAERLFCKIADPAQTPKSAPLFGGNEFFAVRDLSRLALGRVAHEQYRFDDARYYYHLVPADSERLPEALYESATSRYEAKDYAAAHDLLNELASLERQHAYQDEAWILDAYVDLGSCEFARADEKLKQFLRRYEPVLRAARQLASDPGALRGLLAGGEGTVREGAPGLGGSRDVTRALVSAIRVDVAYGVVTRQLANLDHQISGLRSLRPRIEELQAGASDPGLVKARPSSPVADSAFDRHLRLLSQLGAVRRLLRESERAGARDPSALGSIGAELERLQAEAATLEHDFGPTPGTSPVGTDALASLLAQDAVLGRELAQLSQAARAALIERQDELARQAVSRLERRLVRLVRRARTGRIETVLGRKRALELEVEALSQGFLPRGAVDSLDAARYLSDAEEYWPFDGEDWEDEYVGGEGLR
jgi:hypothetical protein